MPVQCGGRGASRVGVTRRRGLALTTVAGAAVGAACQASGDAPGAGTARTTLDAAQKDELIWLVWSSDGGARKQAYDLMVGRFRERFPGVAVTRVAGSGGGLQVTLL